MRNPDQVLREKERELERVKREVEALRLGGPLLEGEDTASDKAINPEPEARKEATTGQIVHGQKWPRLGVLPTIKCKAGSMSSADVADHPNVTVELRRMDRKFSAIRGRKSPRREEGGGVLMPEHM